MKKNLQLLFALFTQVKITISQKTARQLLLVVSRVKNQYSLKKAMPALLSFVIIFFTVSKQAIAQWSDNPAVNNAICVATGDHLNPKIVTDGAGGAIITWGDGRSGSGYNIYAQRVNAEGAIQWTANGIAVSTPAGIQAKPTIVSDGAGGAIITWQDFQSGSNTDIYAQRLNAAGAVQWTADGVDVCTATYAQNSPIIVSDGAGGAIITWYDYRNFKYDIYAQRVNAAGAVQWTADGIAVCTATSDQRDPIIVSDGESGAIITWRDFRSGNLDIYAQRVNASGAVQWTTDGVAICTASVNQYDPAIVSDGDGGAIITWQDFRTFNYAVYAQRVDATGSVQWTTDGVVVSTTAGNQHGPTIVSDGAGGAVITWYDDRSGNFDIYAQRVDASGAMQWTTNGAAICTEGSDQYSPVIIESDDAGGMIIIWESVTGNIYARRVDASGTVQWAADGVAISTAANQQYSPVIVSDGKGGAIITWQDARTRSKYEIYAQNINAGGTIGVSDNDGDGDPNATDCAPLNPAVYHGATEVCNGIDDNCDSDIDEGFTDTDNDKIGDCVDTDDDNDGTPDESDCAPLNSTIHAGATEICGNGIDENCNGMTDDICPPLDSDGDGDPNTTDCAPSNPAIYHGAKEVCNGKDDDCDGYIDEGVQTTYYKDNDKDGYGNKAYTKKACYAPAGYVSNCNDCNDYDKTIYPGAPELCDYKDNDCDGKIDEGLTKKNYYKDFDCDGYGDPKKCISACTRPSRYVTNNKDCNDKDKTIYPGAPELCDNKDNDCDGKVDEYLTKKNYYKDYDKDGYGDPKECIVTCTCPSGYVTNNKDCNDRNKKVNPGCKEIAGNKIDDNCNGKVDEKTASRGVNDEMESEQPQNLLNATNEALKVNLLPNPSYNHFTVNMKGSSDKPAQVRVVDISGRMVEVKNNIPANSTLTIGERYRLGVYFVEVMQGNERVVIKCIKQ